MLTGEAKKNYQREYMKEWQRNHRGSKQGLNIGSNTGLNKPRYTSVPIASIHDTGQIPNCPDGRHRELDADGNPIYSYE